MLVSFPMFKDLPLYDDKSGDSWTPKELTTDAPLKHSLARVSVEVASK